jgi:BirA family biotin operon repressor/biotin-[acetyl-CoA-carboxylase] ligase
MIRFDTVRLGLLLESRGRVRLPVEVFDEIGSTQDQALAMGECGAPAGTIVLARSQTAGRGRLSRSWCSAPGGLYASIVLRPEWPPDRWPVLSLIAGVAVVETLLDQGLGDVRLKWPNDCLVRGMKLAGILAEARPALGLVVMGIGLNASFEASDLPMEVANRSVALDNLVSPERDLHLICALVLERVWSDCSGRGSSAGIDPDVAGRLLWTAGMVTVSGVSGRVAGVAANGELLLEQANGTFMAVSAGEVDDAGCD